MRPCQVVIRMGKLDVAQAADAMSLAAQVARLAKQRQRFLEA
jgi:hypothetical protein